MFMEENIDFTAVSDKASEKDELKKLEEIEDEEEEESEYSLSEAHFDKEKTKFNKDWRDRLHNCVKQLT